MRTVCISVAALLSGCNLIPSSSNKHQLKSGATTQNLSQVEAVSFQSLKSPNGAELVLASGQEAAKVELPSGGSAWAGIADDSTGAKRLFVRADGKATFLSANRPEGLTTWKGVVYFTAEDSEGARGLYKTDGSAVSRVETQLHGARIVGVTPDYLYVAGAAAEGGSKLYRWSGTQLERVSDTRGDLSKNDDPRDVVASGSRVFFTALIDDGARKLFKVSGDSAQVVTSTRKDEGTGADDPYLDDAPELLKAGPVAGELYFVALLSNGVTKLYRTDGTDTQRVSETSGSMTVSDQISAVEVVGSSTYFLARNPDGKSLAYQADEPARGRSSVLTFGFGDSVHYQVRQILSQGSQLYLVLRFDEATDKLFKIDSGGIHLVANFGGVPGASDEVTLLGLGANQELFFLAKDPSGARNLFYSTGTSYYRVTDWSAGQGNPWGKWKNECAEGGGSLLTGGSHSVGFSLLVPNGSGGCDKTSVLINWTG